MVKRSGRNIYMVKLNLGSKYRRLKGFDNLDKIFGWRFQDGLPQYQDDSVDGITISHAVMFLTMDELRVFIKEMYRVLKKGELSGLLRMILKILKADGIRLEMNDHSLVVYWGLKS